jgi:hypothetical protein
MSRQQQLTLKLGGKRDIAAYAIALAARGNAISLPEVSRKLKFAATVVVVSLAITIGLFAFIRLGQDLGEAAPFVMLLWLAFAALFGYAVVALTALVITALTVQHVRIAEAHTEMSEIGEEVECFRAILTEAYRRDPQLVKDAAAKQGAYAQEVLTELAHQ